MVTEEHLKAILPNSTERAEWAAALNELLPRYGIDTPRRVAAFLAQTGHESTDFTRLVENMNYSAKRLREVWPSRFTAASAARYAHKPEAIANKVYSSRMGNGNEASGDGWRFRGRGIKQLTGRYNYTQFGKDVNMTAEEAVDYVATKRGAVESAAWFWKTNNLSRFADANDNAGLTRAINGGTIGLADRDRRFSNAKRVLEADRDPHSKFFESVSTDETVSVKGWPVLHRRMKYTDETRDLVRAVQKKIGFTGKSVDGWFGVATEAGVKSYQARNGLRADGIAGPITLTHMFGNRS